MVPMPPGLSLFFSNGNTLSVFSIYYDLSESYNTFCKQESFKCTEFRRISSPAFRLLYNSKVLWRSVTALQGVKFGICVASSIF